MQSIRSNGSMGRPTGWWRRLHLIQYLRYTIGEAAEEYNLFIVCSKTLYTAGKTRPSASPFLYVPCLSTTTAILRAVPFGTDSREALFSFYFNMRKHQPFHHHHHHHHNHTGSTRTPYGLVVMVVEVVDILTAYQCVSFSYSDLLQYCCCVLCFLALI